MEAPSGEGGSSLAVLAITPFSAALALRLHRLRSMRTLRTSAVAIVLVLLFAAAAADASERLLLRVTPNVSSAPSTVTVRAYVEQSAENRGLRIEADSGSFYRSSQIQLDGDKAPLLTEFRFASLPSGEYTVIATLLDARGDATMVRRRTVLIVSRASEP